MRKMGKWAGWAIVVAAVAMFVFGVGFIVYGVTSRTIANEYTMRMQIALDAAALSDGVFVKEGDTYHELSGASYMKLGYYLTSRPQLALLGGSGEVGELSLRIGEDTVRVVSKGKEGERAIVYFETQGKTFRMQIRENNLWRGLFGCTGEDDYAVPEGTVTPAAP